jgi:asparagine N-glycosylation enzyme membrane subunit Stt3
MSWWDYRYQTDGMSHRFTLVDDNTSNNAQIVEALATVATQLFIIARVVLDLHQPDKERNSRVSLRLWNTLLGMKALLRLFNGTALQTAKGVLYSTSSSSCYLLICCKYGPSSRAKQ